MASGRLAVGLLLALAGSLAAQRPAADEVQVSGGPYRLPALQLTANTNLVVVGVVVRDAAGQPIAHLPQSAFRLLDNGRPQALASFEAQTAPALPSLPYGKPSRQARRALVPAARAPAVPAAPRYVALFFDDVNTDLKDLGVARNAALRFVRQAMGPDDWVALSTTSQTGQIPFTRDRERLAAGIARIAAHPRASRSSFSQCPWVTSYESYLIVVEHDPGAIEAIVEEAEACQGKHPTPSNVLRGGLLAQADQEEILATAQATWSLTLANSEDTLADVDAVIADLARQPGKRILLMASGGFLTMTLEQLQDSMIQRALRADVVINALDAKGLYTEDPGRPLDDVTSTIRLPTFTYVFDETQKFPEAQMQVAAMANLAASTGGLFFQNSNDLALGFERLGLAPEASYNLTFSPRPLVRDGKLHRLTVALVPPIPHAILQFRRGYFAPSPAPPAAALEQDIAAAMRGRGSLPALPAHFTIASDGGVAVDARFDLKRLALPKSDGRYRQRLVLAAGLFDSDGHWVAGRRGELDLALKPDTRQRLLAEGLAAKLDIAAPPGRYRLRVVAAEAGDGRLSAFSQSVTIH